MGAPVGGARPAEMLPGVLRPSAGVKGEAGAVRRGEKRRLKLHDNFSSIDPEV